MTDKERFIKLLRAIIMQHNDDSGDPSTLDWLIVMNDDKFSLVYNPGLGQYSETAVFEIRQVR